MKEFIDIYRIHKDEIERFICDTLENIGSLKRHKSDNYKKIFDILPPLELIYEADSKTLAQTSPNIYRHKISKKPIGRDRKYLAKNIQSQENSIDFTQPYVSSATKNTSITALKQEDDILIFMDFDLFMILQKLGFLELNTKLNILNKSFYGGAGAVMALLATFTIGYAVVSFFHTLIFESDFSIEATFKPIIAITLGLAIYDLAKTILEQEVFFKSYSKNRKNEYNLLIKFLITIIIALMIEALMIVFKIALSDYKELFNAFYLICGIAIVIVSLSIFIKFSKSES